MQLLVYLLAYPILWLVSRLPFRVLYLISDLLFPLVYHIIGYRKKVVRDNLALVFPEKDKSELKTIERKFYRHMCDMFLEMVKTLGISEKELQRRFTFTNVEVIHELEEKNKSMMTLFPHYASWEWTIALDSLIQSKGHAIYQPIGNTHFDNLVRSIREKFGTTLISTRETPKTIRTNRLNNVLSIYGILSDQSPMPKKAQLWTQFMGITVPVHTGAEQLCQKLDLPAVYLKVSKVSRGHYHGTFELLSENPKDLAEFDLTKAFLKKVETAIHEEPAYYFWTHKRWKHKDKVPKAFQYAK